jgi:lipid II:glycine glycyltransferase (peptidoglycan interpeptide bridge formation enzyme)
MRGDGLAPEDIFPASVFYRHTLSLEPGENILWSRLRGNYRRAIQKGEKMGVRVDIHHSPEAMDQYYRLHCFSRKRHGLPPQPLHFFRKIYQHIISQSLGFVVLATHAATTISGAVCVHFGRQILYKYAAMDSKYQDIPANYLLLWRTIQWACENGFQEFCFGKSDAEQKGLILFKDGWRAEKQMLHYYKYHLKKEAFVQTEQRSDGRGYFWFRAMPLPFLKKVGSLLYRHVG